MEIETVIFSSVFNDREECYNQDELKESQGISIPFFNENDYIGQIAINLSDIIGFEQGQVAHNGEMLDCVYGINKVPTIYTRNLLIDKEEFKEMLEYVHNTKIPLASEYLKQIRDASSKKIN